jgi:hypothetical protein
MTKQPYRMDADMTFPTDDADAMVEQIIDVLDGIGVQVDSAYIRPLDPRDLDPDSPLSDEFRQSNRWTLLGSRGPPVSLG